jgi:hypothetical protein
LTEEEIVEIRSRYEKILPPDEAKMFVQRKKMRADEAELEVRKYVANGLANGTLELRNGCYVKVRRTRRRRTLEEVNRDVVAGRKPNSIWTIG